MAENNSRFEEKPELSVFKHIIDKTQISSTSSSSSSAQTLVSVEKILNISRNQLSPMPYAAASAAATCIGYCADIFTQILLRLPPKSLLRFQCVSKQWHSVISNSDFRRLHGKKFHTSCCCLSSESDALLFIKNSELNFICLSGENVKPMKSIVTRFSSFLSGRVPSGFHSSNGLFCFEFFLDYFQREIFVYNPTTNQYKLIPECEVVEEEIDNVFPYATNICFDPLNSDHYKIVSIWTDLDEDAYSFPIYSSETGIWKDTGFSVETTNIVNISSDNGIFWNGNLHWLTGSGSILCFDLNKESLNLLPDLPTDCRYLGETGGCLCYIGNSPSELTLFHVYFMEKDYSEWFLKKSIDLNPLTISYPSMKNVTASDCPKFFFTNVLWGNNEKKTKLVISMQGKIILYNASDENITELVDIEPENYTYIHPYNWDKTITFTPTLASV